VSKNQQQTFCKLFSSVLTRFIIISSFYTCNRWTNDSANEQTTTFCDDSFTNWDG